jgi:membrane-bound lytic murein transglycosylase A
MRPLSFVAAIAAAALLLPACAGPDYGRALPPGAPALLPLEPGEPRPDVAIAWDEREVALEALERSRVWLERPVAAAKYPMAGIDHARSLASVIRLGELLSTTSSASEFRQRVEEEFDWFKSAGWDGNGGGVLFTGYYTPIFDGREEPDAQFRYPLYARPDDVFTKPDGTVVWKLRNGSELPYPTRRSLEEGDMLKNRGLEVAYLRDPFEAYICHVQGSAFLRVESGELLKLGFGGTNGLEYTSLAKALVEAGEIDEDHEGLPALIRWAQQNPERLSEFTHKNDRFVFFQKITGNPHGSLDFPVQSDYSLATDKTLFPMAAPTWVSWPATTNSAGRQSALEHLMFDQDTGGGIRTAGRADVYMGIGDQAGERAGRTMAEGPLYYFFLKPELVGAHLPNGPQP